MNQMVIHSHSNESNGHTFAIKVYMISNGHTLAITVNDIKWSNTGNQSENAIKWSKTRIQMLMIPYDHTHV